MIGQDLNWWKRKMTGKIEKSDAEWRQQLTDEQYKVSGYNFLNAAGASTLGLEGVLTAFYGDPRTFTFGIDYNF